MEQINVFATSDNNYAPYVATTIASIMVHTKSYINFYVIDCGISNENKELIKKEEQIFNNLKIEFVLIDVNTIFSKFPVMKHLSIAMYGKYLISELKNDIDKIIYTDIDVAFVDDIKKLWDEPLDNYTMAAVPSQRYMLNENYRELKEELGIAQSHTYFMSGLMVIDCRKWREQKITEKLLAQTIKFVNMPDQEVLNKIFENNYKIIGVKYCVIYKIFRECYTKSQIEEYTKNQVIVHYPGGGSSKPWNNPFLKSGKYFNKVLKYTAFNNEIKNQQKQFVLHTIKRKLFKK